MLLNDQEINLTSLEKIFLRLNIHGFSDIQIAFFLKIEIKDVDNFKNELEKKFKTNDWVKIIAQSFKMNLFEKSDFVDNNVKQEALKHSVKIMKVLSKNHKLDINVSNDPRVLKYVMSFYNNSLQKKSEYYKLIDRENRLSDLELVYLKLKWKNGNKKNLMYRLDFDNQEIKTIEQSILSKLDVNNWFNAFKKMYEYGLLNE